MKTGKIGIMTIGILTLLLVTTMPLGNADGCHLSVEYLHLYEPYQKAVISWDGILETMILASAARADNLTDIAWIVPIISTTLPNVTAGNITVFHDLVEYFKDTETSFRHDGYNIQYATGDSNVNVLEIKEIDIYDIIILQATNTTDLIDWLNNHQFQIPKEAYSVLDSYIKTGQCYFIINKIDLKNRFQPVLDAIHDGTISYTSSEYIEYQKVLSDLQIGMATPLKFEFTPPKPYYPLTISSLNAGYGRIEVYVVADHPVTDINNVLSLSACKTVSEDLRETLSYYFSTDHAEFVTRLTYYGELNLLNNDAVFLNFPMSKPEKPITTYLTTDVEAIFSEHHIWGVTWDQTGDIFEIQYRFDNEKTWKNADGTKVWSVSLDEASFSDGEHTMFIRVVNATFATPTYSQDISLEFTTLHGAVVTPQILQNYNLKIQALLLSGLVALSLVAVAVISRKIIMKQ